MNGITLPSLYINFSNLVIEREIPDTLLLPRSATSAASESIARRRPSGKRILQLLRVLPAQNSHRRRPYRHRTARVGKWERMRERASAWALRGPPGLVPGRERWWMAGADIPEVWIVGIVGTDMAGTVGVIETAESGGR